MSVRAMAWAWEQELPEGEKLLLMAIADHADDEGVCWPGQEGLARKIGRTDRTVRTRLKHLEALKLIAREPRYNGEGHRTSDRIILLMTTGKLCRRKTLPPEEAASGEPSSISTTTVDSTSSGDTTATISTSSAATPKVQVDRLRLTDEEWHAANRIIQCFNEEAGTAFSLLGTRGRPTDHLKRIVSRLRDYPEVTVERHLEVIRHTCANPWWGEGRPTTVGVIYGPQAFPRCLSMDSGGQGRRFADERRTAPENAPW